MSVFGGKQLLLQNLDIVNQREAILEHGKLADPALKAADLPLQTHQFLSAAALVVLHFILLGTVMLGLNDQLFLART